MADLRAAVSALREGAALDLRPALAALAGSVSRPRVHLTVPEDMGLHDAARAHALFRCVQEIVTNAVRHARAENLWNALDPCWPNWSGASSMRIRRLQCTNCWIRWWESSRSAPASRMLTPSFFVSAIAASRRSAWASA